MSRWICSLDGKTVSVDKWNAFAKLNFGNGAVLGAIAVHGHYGARHQDRFPGQAP